MSRASRIALFAAAGIVLAPIVLVGALMLLVRSEWGERWAERQAATRIGRTVELDGIRLRLAWPPIVSLERLRIGNPAWATSPSLIDADGVSARVLVGPLFDRRVVIPYLEANRAQFGIESKGDAATWRLGGEGREPGRFRAERVVVTEGRIAYRDHDEDTDLDIAAKGSLGTSGQLDLAATGKFRGEPAKAIARVPGLEAARPDAVRLTVQASVGKTELAADGEIAVGFESLDLELKVKGQTLRDLHPVFGLVLPDSPPYRLAGRLRHAGQEWTYDPFEGKVGDSDLRGALTYVKDGKRPLLRANLHSKLLDFDDLGPLVGAPPKTGPGETAAPRQKAKAAEVAASSRVLPHQKFSTERWEKMDADVTLVATRVQRPKQVPIDKLSTHLVLKDGVLHLQPLDFGIAGGRVASRVVIDSHPPAPIADVHAEIQGLKLAQLFPTLKTMDEALGTLYGRADLKGRGASVGDMLGTSNGRIVIAANGGRVSDLLTQLLEIDLARAAMLLGTRKQQVDLRCAVGYIDVKDGVASPETFIVDTTETYIRVEGALDLKQERFHIETRGKGKTPSPFVLRTPVVMEGPLKRPSVHPKGGPIVAQTGVAAALAAVNPLLGIVPFVDPGRRNDADCERMLAEARAKGAHPKDEKSAAGSDAKPHAPGHAPKEVQPGR